MDLFGFHKKPFNYNNVLAQNLLLQREVNAIKNAIKIAINSRTSVIYLISCAANPERLTCKK